MGDTSSLISAL